MAPYESTNPLQLDVMLKSFEYISSPLQSNRKLNPRVKTCQKHMTPLLQQFLRLDVGLARVAHKQHSQSYSLPLYRRYLPLSGP
jgi:hypothetical protein